MLLSQHPGKPQSGKSQSRKLPGVPGHPELDLEEAVDHLERGVADKKPRQTKRHLLPELAPCTANDAASEPWLKRIAMKLLGRDLSV